MHLTLVRDAGSDWLKGSSYCRADACRPCKQCYSHLYNVTLLAPTMDRAEAERTVDAYAQVSSASAGLGAAVETVASRAAMNETALAGGAGKSKPPGS